MFASAGRKLTPTSDRKRSAKYGLHLPLNRQSEVYRRAAVFFYSRDCAGEHAERRLTSYAGLMQVDA